MWLAQKMKPAVPEAEADQGVSTIVGDEMGVVTRGEVRRLPVYGPGGYVWLPESGASVLVIKGGPGGEEQCVCGGQQAAAEQYVAEALAEETGLTVDSVTLTQSGGECAALTVQLTAGDTALTAEVALR